MQHAARFRRWLLSAFTIIGPACAINPVTGERQLSLVSEAQEIEMGRAAAEEVRQTIGLVEDRRLQAYVGRIGVAMGARSERPNLPWSFAVVDDPTPNAFALPGGYIFVTRGLMNLMNSEAELASVLGHEIGHVTARHSVNAMSQQQLAQLGLGVGGFLFPEVRPFSQALEAGLGLLFLEHSRDAERQADDLGFRYALDRDYDVTEMVDVFAALQRAGGERRSPLPAWLTTHPAPGERIKDVQQRIDALPPGQHGTRVERAEYLNRIDGLVYGENPRQGFFQDSTFFHPDLRFQFQLPPGWTGQNLTHTVTALSPRGDAALHLTIATSSNPALAAQQFFERGAVALQSSRTRINGLPAVLSVFDASTQQGPMRGIVAHIGHGDGAYQVIAYTTIDRFAAYSAALERGLRSFAALTDPAVLRVQPKRMDVVRVGQPMTLGEFARRFDSAVPPMDLAVLNHFDDASSRVGAGTLVKRVVS